MPTSPWEVPEDPGWRIILSGNNNNNANNNAIPSDKDHFGLYRQPDGTHIFSYRLTNPANHEIIAGADIITQMRFSYKTSIIGAIERTETSFQYKTITHPDLVQSFSFVRESDSVMESVNCQLVIRRKTPGAVTTKVIHLDEEEYDGWWPVIAEQAPDGLIPDMLPPFNFPIPAVVPPPPPAVLPPAPPPAVVPPPAPSANNEPYEPNMPPPSPPAPSNGPSNKRRRRNTRRRKARLGRKRQSRRRV